MELHTKHTASNSHSSTLHYYYYLVGMLIQHSNYMLFHGRKVYYSADLFWTSPPPTFNIAETLFKHQNVQLGRESQAITFIIHNFHNSRDTSHNSSHF